MGGSVAAFSMPAARLRRDGSVVVVDQLGVGLRETRLPFADRARDRQPCVAVARRARIVHLDQPLPVEQADQAFACERCRAGLVLPQEAKLERASGRPPGIGVPLGLLNRCVHSSEPRTATCEHLVTGASRNDHRPTRPARTSPPSLSVGTATSERILRSEPGAERHEHGGRGRSGCLRVERATRRRRRPRVDHIAGFYRVQAGRITAAKIYRGSLSRRLSRGRGFSVVDCVYDGRTMVPPTRRAFPRCTRSPL